MPRVVFVTGGTGYVGRQVVPQLLARGHRVRLLVRAGSESKAPAGADVLIGNPFDRTSIAPAIPPADTFLQLVGPASFAVQGPAIHRHRSAVGVESIEHLPPQACGIRFCVRGTCWAWSLVAVRAAARVLGVGAVAFDSRKRPATRPGHHRPDDGRDRGRDRKSAGALASCRSQGHPTPAGATLGIGPRLPALATVG